MNSPKIAIYAIGLNETKNIPAWLASTKGCDELYYVDTGSTDGSQQMVEELCTVPGAIVEIAVRPWRFDDARNASLAIVPADVDLCVCLDLDERLCEGWRERLLEVWKPGVTNVLYSYQFAPGNVYVHHRIHARHGYRWKYPDHEMLYAAIGAEMTEQLVTIPGPPLIVQYQDKTARDRSSTLARLAQGIQEYPLDTRMLFYYGRELHYAGRHVEAIDHLEMYLARAKTIQHPVEKLWASEALAACYRALTKQGPAAPAASASPDPNVAGRWSYEGSTSAQRYGGDDVTYEKGMEFLASCDVVEDWGCGTGYAKRFCRGTYRGVDGSPGPSTEVVTDLRTHVSAPDGIFMRHILEHNPGWRDVLDNAIRCFGQRLVVILFTPLQEETRVIAANPTFGGVPDIAFRREDILERLGGEGFEVKEESVATQTQYGVEHLFYVTRKTEELTDVRDAG